MTASDIQYDTIAESKYHWTANNWKVRTLRGLREKIQMGAVKDTVIPMEPADLIYSKRAAGDLHEPGAETVYQQADVARGG